MNNQSAQKEILHWNIRTFHHLHAFSSLLNTHLSQTTPQQYQLQMRDFYFNPNFDILGYKNRKSFIQLSSQYLQNYTAFNQLAYLQSLSFERQLQKHKFWNKVRKMYTKTKEEHQAKSTISSIVWTYRLMPITIFLFAGAAVLRVSGVYKMSLRKQLVAFVTATIMGDYFVRAKKSSQIFYLIPPLPQSKLESERVEILNKSIVLDSKINQIDIHPDYVDQLIDQADKEQNPQERLRILEAAGYKVVDSVDFQY